MNKPTFHLVLSMFVGVLCVAASAQATPQINVPWQCSFEETEDLSDWILNSGTATATDQWHIGTATHSDGKQALYISTNGGTIAQAGAQANIVMAYRKIHFPEHASGYKEYDISFDWKALGDGTLYVYFDYYSTLITGPDNLLQYANSSSAVGLPKSILNNAKYVYSTGYSYRQDMKGELRWRGVSIGAGEGETYSERLSAKNSKRDYALVFVWVNRNMKAEDIDMGACVDNIQIASATYEKPTNLQAIMQCEDSSFLVKWTGNIREYSVEYRKSNQNAWRRFTWRSTPPSFQYIIKMQNEGTYDFRVRGWNGTDTTAYTVLNSQLFFCMENHCINYVDLDHADCTFGPLGNLEQYSGRVDDGPNERTSFHTVYTDVNEYDPRTNYMMRTIPEGELASVRLGTWVAPGSNTYTFQDGTSDNIGGATITYDITVDTLSQALLLLKYAMVMEYPEGHSKTEMPYFSLQVLDANGNVLDMDCGTKEFYCPEKAEDAIANGWKIFDPKESNTESNSDMGIGSIPIYWKDWTTMGVNLREQSGVKHGDRLKVRVTARGCALSGHYCYGYFTLDCASADITTDQCSGNPVAVADAPEGFSYTWFAEKDKELLDKGQYINDKGEKIIRSLDANLEVQAGDTNVYICRLSDLVKPSCYFELKTKLSPRSPFPMYTYTPETGNCQNIITFTDSARIADYDADGKFRVTNIPCEYSNFSVRSLVTGQQETNANQTFTYLAEAEGDILEVTQTSYIADGNCDKTTVDTIYISSITTPDSLIRDTVCRNIGYTFYGEHITKTGTYIHKMQNRFGCDSLEVLNLTVNPISATNVVDTISAAQLPYTLSGYYKGTLQNYDRGREEDYATTQNYTVKFSNSYDCDSTVNLSLTVIPILNVLVDKLAPLCADDSSMTLGYTIQHGNFDSLYITFDAGAHTQGFYDTVIYHNPYAPLEKAEEHFSYAYSNTILPNVYTVRMKFYQHPVCQSDVEDVLSLDIRYSSSILQQKWETAIFLRNKDYNGGYTFTEYQWYKNGQPIPGEAAKKSFWQEDGGLDTNAEYCVLLTRASDNVRQFTCSIVPEKRTPVTDVNASEWKVPTLVTVGQHVALHINQATTAAFYTPTGMLYSTQTLPLGDNTLMMPRQEGCYLLRLIAKNGTVHTQIILVKP